MPPVGPQVDRLKREMDRRAALVVREVVQDAITGLVDGTPVDTPDYTDIPGVARGNWNIGIGTEDTTFSEARANPAGPPPVLPAVPIVGETVYLTNHTPYAEVLEYGGYPVPVKRGSWNRRLKQYVIKSVGGFSQQAPAGWVRLVAAEIQPRLERALGALRG